MNESSIMSNDYIAFETDELSGLPLEIIKNEVNETEETKAQGLFDLRKKLKEVRELRPCLKEEFLLQFLRVARFDTTKAFNRIIRYYHQQKKSHLRFQRHYRNTSSKLRSVYFNWTSPYRLENGSILAIHKYGIVDFTEVDVEEKVYLDLLIIQRFLQNPITQRCGLTMIYDWAGFSFNKAMKHTPGKLKLFLDIFQNSVPLRMRAVHMVNAGRACSTVFNIVHPFLSTKLQNRIYIHPSNDEWNSLHSVIPKDFLPVEYGGHLKHSNLINLVDFGYEFEEQYLSQLQYGFVSV